MRTDNLANSYVSHLRSARLHTINAPHCEAYRRADLANSRRRKLLDSRSKSLVYFWFKLKSCEIKNNELSWKQHFNSAILTPEPLSWLSFCSNVLTYLLIHETLVYAFGRYDRIHRLNNYSVFHSLDVRTSYWYSSRFAIWLQYRLLFLI